MSLSLAETRRGPAPRDPAPAERVGRGAVAFFHQNDVFDVQGGIERYVSTLFEAAPDRVVLVGPAVARASARRFCVADAPPRAAPRWLRFLLGLFRQRRNIAAFLREHDVRIMEFSRPEYVLAAWLFPGRRVVTIHGTGPGPGHRLHSWLHRACCLLLPLLADRVQVIGRDPSGVPWPARVLLGPRLAYVDAWRDDAFTPAAMPPLAPGAPLRVFYAGRVAPQKNPRLLFEIVRAAAAGAAGEVEFHYFGADFAAFEAAGLGGLVEDHGLLGAPALAEAIRSCHLGILCSAFGEGSPYILIEALGCGRPFVVPALPTLVSAYRDAAGVHFVESGEARDYVAAMAAVRAGIVAGEVDPAAIAAPTAARSKSRAAPVLLDALERVDG